MKFNREIGQFLHDAVDAVLKATGLPNAQVALDADAFLEETMRTLDKAQQAAARKAAREAKKTEVKTSGNIPEAAKKAKPKT